jgi:hypothetical protein
MQTEKSALCGAVKDEGVEIDDYFKPCTLKVKSDHGRITSSRPQQGDIYLKSPLVG